MNRIFTCWPASVLLATASAAAQTKPVFSLGVRGGLNQVITTIDPAVTQAGNQPFSFSTNKSALTSWQAGLVGEARFGKLAFQPALLFSQKGEHVVFNTILDGIARTYSNQESTNRYNWLELPLNMVYTLHGDHGLQLLAGPYLALGVGGHQQGRTTGYYGPAVDIWPGEYENRISYGPGTYNRRLDVGLNFGLGYRLGPVQVQVQASYGLGLRNLHMDDGIDYLIGGQGFYHKYQADAAYNRVAQLTGTYFLKL
jgi:hypothetical protein